MIDFSPRSLRRDARCYLLLFGSGARPSWSQHARNRIKSKGKGSLPAALYFPDFAANKEIFIILINSIADPHPIPYTFTVYWFVGPSL